MGKDTMLFQRTADGDPESLDSAFVAHTQTWFDSVWNTIATPKQW